MAENKITLKVAEAISQKDVGQGIARLDPKIMDSLNIHERELVEITGEKELQLLHFLHKLILDLELLE